MSYREDIWRFEARNVQEEADQRQILAFIRRDADGVLRRENPAHITTSALVFNPTKTKVLLVFHNQFRAWSWTGAPTDRPGCWRPPCGRPGRRPVSGRWSR